MWEEVSTSKEGEHAESLDASQETSPEAVCRADRSKAEVLAKYRDSYLYRDYKIPYCLKILCTAQL